ncbi:flagellin [Botrimarina sp.]|uniref:flagellin N-terminal helical domain-containing protein n=1 Tax=Botrimarina sp. TaxID=2795802 RepID=UPI0032EF8098
MTRINTNVSSLIGRNNLNRANASLSQSLTRLSTGLRINTGKDDPAGLIASENLRSDITAIRRAIGNTDRANQVIATADSALGQVSSLLNDIRGLVTESANSGALSDEQIRANQSQVDSSLAALNRIAQTTTFQGRKLLDGSLDFVTTPGSNFSNISDLAIDQANLGASGSVGVNVSVSQAATQALVDVEGFPDGSIAASTTATFATAANAASGSVSLTVNVPAVQASGTFTAGTTSTVGFDITAVAGQAADGVTGNDVDVILVDNDDDSGNIASVVFDDLAGTLTITGDFDGSAGGSNSGATGTQVADAIDAEGTFVTSNRSAGVGNNLVAADATTYSDVTSNGANATTGTETIDIVTNSDATGGNLSLTFQQGTTAGVADFGDGAYTITYTSGQTINDIVSLLENGTITEIDAAATGVATGSSGTSVLSGVTLANQAINGYVAAGNDVITISAADGGTAGNGKTVTIQESAIASEFDATTGVGVAVDGSGNITVSLDASRTDISIQDIVDAIDDTGEYVAELTTSDGSGTYDATTATPPSVANTAGGAATGGSQGIASAVVFELTGSNGSEVLSFGAGTTLTGIINGINLLSDATGVQARANGTTSTTLELFSTTYGRDSVVDIEVISEAATGVFTTGLANTGQERVVGVDALAAVNGVAATTNGNRLSINTSTLDLNLTLAEDFTGSAAFTITGGGAKFQLGPDVVSNQQARLGIGSVNTSRLGGVSGKLFQLENGGSFDLSTDPNQAAKIIEEAIDQVTSLRGRLGAFQRTTLETNKNALNDTLSNLTEAESSIRDADFAEETASLTRSQILVQSGTRVLAIANQNPQNVLALLG